MKVLSSSSVGICRNVENGENVENMENMENVENVENVERQGWWTEVG